MLVRCPVENLQHRAIAVVCLDRDYLGTIFRCTQSPPSDHSDINVTCVVLRHY